MNINPNSISIGSVLKYKNGKVGIVSGFAQANKDFFILSFNGRFKIEYFEGLEITNDLLIENEFKINDDSELQAYQKYIDFPDYIYNKFEHTITLRKLVNGYGICLDDPEEGSITYLKRVKFYHELQDAVMFLTQETLKFKQNESK